MHFELIQTAGLCAVGHELRHVLHGEDEHKRQLRHRQFFAARVGEVAVLEVVRLKGGHSVHKAVAAVVVGQDEAVGRNHLGRAAATELSDAVLEAWARLAVELADGYLQASSTERVGKVLLFHEFQEPHAAVGLCLKARRQHGEGNEQFLHSMNLYIYVSFYSFFCRWSR